MPKTKATVAKFTPGQLAELFGSKLYLLRNRLGGSNKYAKHGKPLASGLLVFDLLEDAERFVMRMRRSSVDVSRKDIVAASPQIVLAEANKIGAICVSNARGTIAVFKPQPADKKAA